MVVASDGVLDVLTPQDIARLLLMRKGDPRGAAELVRAQKTAAGREASCPLTPPTVRCCGGIIIAGGERGALQGLEGQQHGDCHFLHAAATAGGQPQAGVLMSGGEARKEQLPARHPVVKSRGAPFALRGGRLGQPPPIEHLIPACLPPMLGKRTFFL